MACGNLLFFLEDFYAMQSTSMPQINSIYGREFLKTQGTISVDFDTEVFLHAKGPAQKSEGKKTKSSYFCNNWSLAVKKQGPCV